MILNASSGGSRNDTAQMIAELFQRRGIDATVVLPEPNRDVTEYARQAVSSGYSVIVAAGGDGTLNAVAAAMLGTDATLGVLPLGTLNHFAKDLAIPLDLEAAIDNIATGRAVRVDVGDVNGNLFLNNSSVGLYPTLVRTREGYQRLGRNKWTAFARAMLTVLGRYSLIYVSIEAEGKRLLRRTPIVFVGNNEYELTGLRIGARSRIDRGYLAVYVTRDAGRWRLFWFAVRALFGKLRDAADFESLQVSALSVAVRRKRVHVATDGEVNVLVSPLEYRIRPQALSVIVPAKQVPDSRPAT